jgi:hypothetical protein
MRLCPQMLAKTGSTIASRLPSPADYSPDRRLHALLGIDFGLHLIDQVGLLRIHRSGKIPARGSGFVQTSAAQA